MSLVQYSDSEGSDDEQTTQITTSTTKKEPSSATVAAAPATKAPSQPPDQKFSSIVNRGNPRKIRVALPRTNSEGATDADNGDEDGPARKKPRTAGGGLFSGFNSMLPAPKRANTAGAASSSSKKTISLKTGAGPGFDRQADAEWRQEQSLNPVSSTETAVNDTIPKPGSLRNETFEGSLLKEENYKKKGNAMAFKPLSVARNAPKKKSATFVAARAAPAKPSDEPQSTMTTTTVKTVGASPSGSSAAPPQPAPKPKISLFSFSKSEDTATNAAPADEHDKYESIVYNPVGVDGALNIETDEDSTSLEQLTKRTIAYPAPSTQQESTLDTIADDLNLSRAQRRQLMGRNPGVAQSHSKILTFNTEAEYASNQEMLARTSEQELAAQQHNPVRAISGGKHSLRQLVQVASSQKDALEESFAAGRRNKKEAGSRYGW